jgi:hypothetical protein
MLEILVSCVISSIILLTSGNLFCSYFFKQDIYKSKNFSEHSIYGVIFLSFLSLIINFFIPIGKLVGTTILIISFVLFLNLFLKTNKKKQIILYIFYTSVVTLALVLLANVNRPDAGLYHLPYISLLNENKIILGSTNIHFRFGHISSIQYLSAIYNNYIFTTSIITVPLASVTAIILVYLTEEFFLLFNSKKKLSFIIFLILIFSIFSFNRYSSFGNDAPAHLYYLILIIYFLKIESLKECNLNTFLKIFIITIFLATLKLFLVIIAIIPFFIFLSLKEKKQILFNKKIFIFSILGLLWILKNLLVSGCLLYPVQKTCFKNLIYYDAERTKETVYVSEAWAKGWSDQKEIILNYEKYNKNFNWVKTWSNKHLKKIIEKLTPFLIFIFLIILILKYSKVSTKEADQFEHVSSHRLIELFLINLFFLIFWFLKFPIYRYGMSFISLTIILVSFVICSDKVLLTNKKIFFSLIIIGFLSFFSKNAIRIYDNINIEYFNYPWPKIYSLKTEDLNNEKKFLLLSNKNKPIYYYSKQELCMYSASPCSNYLLEKLDKKQIYGYQLYWKTE